MRMGPGDIMDVTGATYTFLINGLPPAANWTALFKPGEKVRFRFINSASMSTFDVRIPDLPLRIVHNRSHSARWSVREASICAKDVSTSSFFAMSSIPAGWPGYSARRRACRRGVAACGAPGRLDARWRQRRRGTRPAHREGQEVPRRRRQDRQPAYATHFFPWHASGLGLNRIEASARILPIFVSI